MLLAMVVLLEETRLPCIVGLIMLTVNTSESLRRIWLFRLANVC